MKLKSNMIMTIILIAIRLTNAQTVSPNPELLKGSWTAEWVTHPNTQPREYGVYHFRKEFSLGRLPSSFIVNVTADNRYRLFVNGVAVCAGPARGDLFNWYYETIDLKPYLVQGKNIIAAQVWNMGNFAAVGQISNQTAFLLQGNTDSEKMINTDASWRVVQDNAYKACSLDNAKRLKAYMVVGPGDQVDGASYPWDWEKKTYDDQTWQNATPIARPEPVGYGTDNRWTLAPRNIPLFNDNEQRFMAVSRTTGLTANVKLINGQNSLVIPANQTVSILLDNSVNTAAYPELIVSSGKGSSIKLTYAEALFDHNGIKGNRNEIDNKEIKGNYDIFLPDGESNRKFRPLWFRGYRYLQLDITTKLQPLIINDIYSMRTGYPLEMNASFSANDATLQKIWNTGWRTAQLCAGEMYYDTPYYEQLQYTGDSRIQALISLYNSGDDRLMRKAILDFYHSRTPEGLTQGRYPSNRLQIIPPFSLFWVSMIHDYWMHRKDDGFVKQFLPAINEVMEWYNKRIDREKHMLGPLTWWNFVDWDNFNDWGVPSGVEKGNSSILTLQYAYTLEQAADLFRAFNHQPQSNSLKALAARLSQSTFMACYNTKKGLVADSPEQTDYSQHAGIWAVLSGAMPTGEIPAMMKRLLEDKSIGQVTFFYRFYLTQALKKAGMADLYYSELKPWRDMLKLGLTTFAEKPEPTRSDCHAWSASPNYDFLATICGIMPDAPGFTKVLIKPALGELNSVECTMPHPAGKISIKLQRHGKEGIVADVSLPEGLTGTFIWKTKKRKITAGDQTIKLI
jgi:alpha-L-rhamnosidase